MTANQRQAEAHPSPFGTLRRKQTLSGTWVPAEEHPILVSGVCLAQCLSARPF